MVKLLRAAGRDARWLARRIEDPLAELAKAEPVVGPILDAVRREGDRALLRYTAEFDGRRLTSATLEVPRQRLQAAWEGLPAGECRVLEAVRERVEAFHRRCRVQSWLEADGTGLLGQRWVPLERVGIYIPGGKAVYPSTVLMTVLPARVAGVETIIVVSPPGRDGIHPRILAACHLAGVDRVFQVGGAQAVAALAYGTETVPAVDKIVGPGNIYVAAAKRQVFGQVAVDMIAGPTELVVIADSSADAALVASDLLAQAEHDELARAILLTPSGAVARAVAREVARQLVSMRRRQIIRRALERHGALVVVASLEAAATWANRIAPEHLLLAVREPYALLHRIRHAGAVFLGEASSPVFGDYVAGPSHVLPTGGTARFFSPLGVEDFVKRQSVVALSPAGARVLGRPAVAMARMEGLEAHGAAVRRRAEGGR
ncbi:MAG: histidinol dehydrogenase [Deltaproteobacteria bacterium]|nr:histidinol dehydrogenase [Deltaproteobacteria bacterium]